MVNMKQKKFENSILIEGDYNFNYLTNLLFLARTCIINIFEKKGLDAKKNKKIYKNVRNLCDFLNSSIDVFSRLSIQENEDKCILHTIEYKEDKPSPVPVLEDIDLSDTTSAANECLKQTFNVFPVCEKLPNDVIKKNKEVDNKYNEED